MYWDWKDVPTSSPCSIVEGVNVLSMEVTNGNAPNIDCIRIIVNENTEPEPEPSDSLIAEGGVKKRDMKRYTDKLSAQIILSDYMSAEKARRK